MSSRFGDKIPFDYFNCSVTAYAPEIFKKIRENDYPMVDFSKSFDLIKNAKEV